MEVVTIAVRVADKLQQYNDADYFLVDSSAVEYIDKDGNSQSVKDILDNGTGVDLSEYTKTFTSLNALGLTAPITVGEIFNAMPNKTMAILSCEDIADHITDVPIAYGVLTIKKSGVGRFSIDYQNSLFGSPCNVKRWIGTLKGSDGTGLYWKQLSTQTTYTTLSDIGLTADATVEDVVNALKNGESFLAPVNTFTNYETIFPNKVPNDQWNKIHIIKGTSLASSHIRCFSPSGTFEYLANINNTNIVAWNDVSGTYIDISDSIIEKLGTEILKYPVGKYRINSTATGNKFTDLPSNAETKCGLIEINGTAVGKSPFTDAWVYRMYKFECLTGTLSYVRRLNSGATTGKIEIDTGWQKTNSCEYHSISQLNKAKGTSIELVNGEDNTQKIMDALGVGDSYLSLYHNDSSKNRFGISTSIGSRINRLHIEKILDANGNTNYCVATAYMNTGVVLNRTNYGGTLSAWVKTPSDARVTTLETQVSELFQSVSDGKKSVANAITGKGVSTSSTATFATMATNISKISAYKEETKSLIVTSSTTGTEALKFTFSANVIAVKKIVAPSDSCRIVPQTSKVMLTINGKELIVHVTGSGTWKVTALIQA